MPCCSAIVNTKRLYTRFWFLFRKDNQSFITKNSFPVEKATLRNQKKLTASNKKKCEEQSRSNQGQNSNVSRSQEDYITQVSKEIEWTVTKKLSQEFIRTEDRISGALARLDDSVMNPLIQVYYGTAQETSRNAFSTNQGTLGDNCQSDPHPEASIFRSQTKQNSYPEVGHDMVTGVHEEITNCSPSTSSGKQKRNCSTSQPQILSWITPATIESDQILLALQHFAKNNTSANFHNNINRISKLPKSLTTMMPMFYGKSEKFELSEYLF